MIEQMNDNWHCGHERCPAMDYAEWLLGAIEGRLAHLWCDCIDPDFDKNLNSKLTHYRTVLEYYQFARKTLESVCNWIRCDRRCLDCKMLQDIFPLLIRDIRDKILTPLKEKVHTDKEAGACIDSAGDAVTGVLRRLAEVRALVVKNQRNYMDSLADEIRGV